jgi:hypothetical protein
MCDMVSMPEFQPYRGKLAVRNVPRNSRIFKALSDKPASFCALSRKGNSPLSESHSSQEAQVHVSVVIPQVGGFPAQGGTLTK